MAPLLPTPSSHLIQVTSKPKPRVALDECSFCHQKGHWKHACPKLLQMTGSTPRSKPTSSRPAQQHSRPPQQYVRPPAAFVAPATESIPHYPSFEQYQEYRAYSFVFGCHPRRSFSSFCYDHYSVRFAWFLYHRYSTYHMDL